MSNPANILEQYVINSKSCSSQTKLDRKIRKIWAKIVPTTVRPCFVPFLVREKSGINQNSMLWGYSKKHNLFQKMALFEVTAM